eukprot:985868_1
MSSFQISTRCVLIKKNPSEMLSPMQQESSLRRDLLNSIDILYEWICNYFKTAPVPQTIRKKNKHFSCKRKIYEKQRSFMNKLKQNPNTSTVEIHEYYSSLCDVIRNKGDANAPSCYHAFEDLKILMRPMYANYHGSTHSVSEIRMDQSCIRIDIMMKVHCTNVSILYLN